MILILFWHILYFNYNKNHLIQHLNEKCFQIKPFLSNKFIIHFQHCRTDEDGLPGFENVSSVISSDSGIDCSSALHNFDINKRCISSNLALSFISVHKLEKVEKMEKKIKM